MRENSGYTGSQIALAFFGGAAAGGAIALLTAPKSGRETRHQVRGYLQQGKRKAAQLPDSIKTATTKAREAFEDAISDVESAFIQ